MPLALSRWRDVHRRLLPRVRLRDGAGPLSRPFGPDLEVDIAITLSGLAQSVPATDSSAVDVDHLIGVDERMMRCWGRSGTRIRSAAAANLARLDLPTPTVAGPGWPGLWIVAGSVWATGLVTDPDLLMRLLRSPGLAPVGSGEDPIVAVASETSILVAVDQEARAILPTAAELLSRLVDDPLPATVSTLTRADGGVDRAAARTVP